MERDAPFHHLHELVVGEHAALLAAPAPGVSFSPVPPAEPEVASLRSASQAVRVDIRKLDRLMNVVGELVLVKTSLGAVAERLNRYERKGRVKVVVPLRGFSSLSEEGGPLQPLSAAQRPAQYSPRALTIGPSAVVA